MNQRTHFKFTKERLEAIKPPDFGRTMYHDTHTKGLKVRVSASGSKVFYVYRKPTRGRRPIKVKLGPFPEMTVDNATRKAIKHLGTLMDGISPNDAMRAERARSITLQQCLDDYLSSHSKLSESTRTNYLSMIAGRLVEGKRKGGHLTDWLDRKLRDIDRNMVADRHQRIAGNVGPVAANNVMRVLRALFNFANGEYENESGHGLYPDNPVRRISHRQAWNPETRRTRVVRPEELPGWYEALKTLRGPVENRRDACAATVADYLEFVLFTGLRRRDALSLRWTQVDLAGAAMFPVIHKKRGDEAMAFPLSKHALSLLQRRHKARVNDFVFPGREPFDEKGHAKRFEEPKRQIKRMVELSGVAFSSHDLRRTFITAAERLDISPFALKRLCAHSVSGDVTGGYMQITVERLREPTEKIAEYLLRSAGLIPTADVVEINQAAK